VAYLRRQHPFLRAVRRGLRIGGIGFAPFVDVLAAGFLGDADLGDELFVEGPGELAGEVDVAGTRSADEFLPIAFFDSPSNG
jgi:hypothetical protein